MVSWVGLGVWKVKNLNSIKIKTIVDIIPCFNAAETTDFKLINHVLLQT